MLWNNYVNIFQNVIGSCAGKAEFSAGISLVCLFNA